MKTKIILSIFVLVSLISCNTENNSQKEEAHEEHGPEGVVVLNEPQRQSLNLKTGPFQMRNLTTVVKTNGQLEVPPTGRADVTVAIGGNVKSIKVFLGDKVKKGQLLAVLEHPDYIALQEDFAVVASQLEYLEKNYERQKELFENNVGSGRDYQQAKAEYNTSMARYEGLKSRLLLLDLSPEKVKKGSISNTVSIYAPISGFVNKINVKIGSFADAKNKLFEITDNSAIHADFMVYEKDVYLLKDGQRIHFTVSSLPGLELTATIFAIGKEFEPNTRAVHIHANIDSKAPGLIPGMYITGHLHTDETYTRTLPNDAIVNEGTKSFIFIVDETALDNHEADDGHGEHNHEAAESHEEHGHEATAEEHDGHGHDAVEKHDEHETESSELMAFRMVEIMTGRKDGGYTEVKLINPLPKNTLVVLNAAYYLLADMNKEETEHKH
ncbi:MAG: efflux RND transporter periplasmic adaptor subunit [Bacteroidales bacterium]|nr:efflux RND transporter periplasmic adaptor subunit [Bacteroidales bacterium]